jgi:hypothetical protein
VRNYPEKIREDTSMVTSRVSPGLAEVMAGPVGSPVLESIRLITCGLQVSGKYSITNSGSCQRLRYCCCCCCCCWSQFSFVIRRRRRRHLLNIEATVDRSREQKRRHEFEGHRSGNFASAVHVELSLSVTEAAQQWCVAEVRQ